jgi:uridylate kinase
MSGTPRYQRILLKVSGEMLGGSDGEGIVSTVLEAFAEEIHGLRDAGIQTAVVIGGGNIFRGIGGAKRGMDRATADTMGMLATCINALALQDALERRGCHTRVMSAIQMHQVSEPYIRRRATRHLEKGRVVLFAAGTGQPFFSTDTAAALRAAEIGADIIIKATKVDGVFDKDPTQHPDAVRFDRLDYIEVLKRDLRVMDQTAITMCRENHIPILVMAFGAGRVVRAATGEPLGTLVSEAMR